MQRKMWNPNPSYLKADPIHLPQWRPQQFRWVWVQRLADWHEPFVGLEGKGRRFNRDQAALIKTSMVSGLRVTVLGFKPNKKIWSIPGRAKICLQPQLHTPIRVQGTFPSWKIHLETQTETSDLLSSLAYLSSSNALNPSLFYQCQASPLQCVQMFLCAMPLFKVGVLKS